MVDKVKKEDVPDNTLLLSEPTPKDNNTPFVDVKSLSETMKEMNSPAFTAMLNAGSQSVIDNLDFVKDVIEGQFDAWSDTFAGDGKILLKVYTSNPNEVALLKSLVTDTFAEGVITIN